MTDTLRSLLAAAHAAGTENPDASPDDVRRLLNSLVERGERVGLHDDDRHDYDPSPDEDVDECRVCGDHEFSIGRHLHRPGPRP